jgi:predicted DNA-binding transcriptional regulator YafY
MEKDYSNIKNNRIINSLKMLELLKNNSRMKAREISEKIGVNNQRSIYYYKVTLEQLGYKIVTHGGYDGGYELIKPERLTEDELDYIAEKINDSSLMRKIERINKRD